MTEDRVDARLRVIEEAVAWIAGNLATEATLPSLRQALSEGVLAGSEVYKAADKLLKRVDHLRRAS